MIRLSQPQRVTASLLLLFSATTASAQSNPPTPAAAPLHLTGSIAGHPGWPVAKPEDVTSPEAILNAVYSVISGPQGQPRDWDRMRSLFIPDARLIPTLPSAGHADAAILTIDGYIARATARTTTTGFYERSVHNETEQ